MAVVALFALDFALIGPLLRGDEYSRGNRLGWLWLLLSTPVLLEYTIYLLAVPPPFRDWLIWIVLGGPLAAILGLIAVAGLSTAFTQRDCANPAALVSVPLMLLMLYLIRRLIPKRCPGCGRRGLLRDFGADEFRAGSPNPTDWCCSCGSRFRRHGRGPWESVTLTEGNTCAPTAPSDSASRSAG
jgi:hypothetical protein